MRRSFYYQKPLRWAEFENLMVQLNQSIEQNPAPEKLVRYQTAIALGVHLGLKAKELMDMRWKHIIDTAYHFRYEHHRPSMRLPDSLRKIIDKNYRIVNPTSLTQYVVTHTITRGSKPVRPLVFNGVLSKIFDKYGISTPAPNSETLRKTYALNVWESLEGSDEAMHMLASHLGIEPRHVKAYITL